MTPPTNGNLERAVRNRVRMRKEFYGNLIVWLVLLINLAAFTYLFDWPAKWLALLGLGWGVVILVHYLAVFGIPVISRSAQEWEDRQVEKELARLKHKSDAQLQLKEPPMREGKALTAKVREQE